jgi:hypothetical protein
MRRRDILRGALVVSALSWRPAMAEGGVFPFQRMQVNGADALAAWERMKGDGGGWPIVIGAEEDFERVAESLQFGVDDGRTAQAMLDAAATLRFPEDFRRRKHEEMERFRTEHPEWADEEEGEGPERGDWPATPPESSGLHVDRDILTQRYHSRVEIIRLPTTDWTEAPAHLSYGGWNDCPFPHEHVAAFRSWRDRYGVELAGMSGDVITMRAQRLPSTREEALVLAQEQYDYCSDIVDQGVGTLDNLAAALMAHRWWFFWWD